MKKIFLILLTIITYNITCLGDYDHRNYNEDHHRHRENHYNYHHNFYPYENTVVIYTADIVERREIQLEVPRYNYYYNESNIVIVNLLNNNGSFTSVKLFKTETGCYLGPKGEIYFNLPTEYQLRIFGY